MYTRQRDFEVKSRAEENRLSRAIVTFRESKCFGITKDSSESCGLYHNYTL